MDNPLSNINGSALREQSEFLLNLRKYATDQMGDKAIEALDGLINLLDEVRSYCHDEHGIDCLLHDCDYQEENTPPCHVCGHTGGCGA